MKWSEGLRNRVSIITRRYTDHMKLCCFLHILLVLLCIVVYACMFCTLLFNFIYYVFLLFLCSVLCIVFHCVVLCTVCV